MTKFSVIIPNYNNDFCCDDSGKSMLSRCIESVLNQTYENFELILVDDCSTDTSYATMTNYAYKDKRVFCYKNDSKKYNGGTRNIGINKANGDYILFIDSDDYFVDNTCLQYISDIIVSKHNPDCISLSYNCLVGENSIYQEMTRNTQKDLVDSLYVACWTKCIKRKLIQNFPENTLMEDVVQHIKQCDKLKYIVSCSKPIIVWNRNNPNSCSKEENQNCQNGKWQSSMYRYAADLMDLQCDTDCCEEHRKWRLEIVLNNIKEGKYIQ